MRKIKIFLVMVAMALFVSGCQISAGSAGTDTTIQVLQSQAEPGSQLHTPPSQADWDAEYEDNLAVSTEAITPANVPITPENAGNISLKGTIYPYSPVAIDVSADGYIAAVGLDDQIAIYRKGAGEPFFSIDWEKERICDFDYRQPFQISTDGGFIVVANHSSWQVWQIGGGIIFERERDSATQSGSHVCFPNFPQMAISPDGKFLAIHDMQREDKEFREKFYVIDVLANENVYDWDGSADGMRGDLNRYPGLGFSPDGKYLQVFDPSRYQAQEGNTHQAFRFLNVDSWQEVRLYFSGVQRSYPTGDLLFGHSREDSVRIRDRITGDLVATIEKEGCHWDYPCGVVFSKNGAYAGIMDRKKIEPFRGIKLVSSATIYNIESGDSTLKTIRPTLSFQSIDLTDDGGLTAIDESLTTSGNTWWTTSGYFSGLQRASNGAVQFTPQKANAHSEIDDYYWKTCVLDPPFMDVGCVDYFIDNNGQKWLIAGMADQAGFQFTDVEDAENRFEIPIPKPNGGEEIALRYLGSDQKQQIRYVCVDINRRAEGCSIYDTRRGELLEGLYEFDGVGFSELGYLSAFVDKKERALMIINSDAGTMKKIGTYQAVAYPIPPIFIGDGSELLYFVQTTESTRRIYIERIDALKGKVIERYDVEAIRKMDVSAFAADPKGNLLAIGNADGGVTILETQTMAVITEFDTHQEAIISIEMDASSEHLMTMGRSGIIKVWQVLP